MVAVKARKATAYVLTLAFFSAAAMALLHGASTMEAFLKAGALCLVCTGLAIPLLKLIEEALEKAEQAAKRAQQGIATAIVAPPREKLQDDKKSS
jgi:hypothetical protein